MEKERIEDLPNTYLLNGRELQELFGVSSRTLKRWMNNGVNLPVVIVGKSRRYPYGEMKKFFARRTYTNTSKTKKWNSVRLE